MSNDNLYKKTRKGLLTLTVSSGGVFILQFITTLILARIFSPEEFGVLTAIMIIISFTDVFWQAGIGPAIVQKKNLSQDDVKTGFTTMIAFGVFVSLLVIAVSPLIAQVINIEESMVLTVLSISFIINSFGVVPISILQREMHFSIIVKKDIYSSLSYAGVAILLGVYGYGVWALVVALLTKYIVSTLIPLFSCPTKLSFGFKKESFIKMMHFGGGTTLSRLFNVIANQGDHFVITRTVGLHDLGLYNRAYQLIAIPANLIGQVIDQVFFPAMSTIQDDNEKLSEIHTIGVASLALLYFPIGTLIYFFSDEIIVLLLGETWAEASIPLKVLALFIFFRVVYKMSDPLCRAKGAVYGRAVIQMIFASMMIIFAIIGSKYGLYGVSIGVGCALVGNYIIMTVFVQKLIKFNIMYYVRCVFPIFIAQFICFSIINIILTHVVDYNLGNIIVIGLLKLTLILIIEGFMVFVVYRYLWPKNLRIKVSEEMNEFISKVISRFLKRD
ncbi:lipopolysaccharide biosynthesis protein [Chengkuizengella sediminis]|uniref:lipopolysaccharide biosynthesis protein n=1 Tax=Chengkuizengella sediminis TaxID=1885917 RepID=UPI00138A1C52|nr:lipopolysaccharide biosynthesis protein [Chengkuizengella sediminis]NDI34877.1 lipopolysaccharide biosynthesis protein [Chengkuizengella sediminis]